MYSNQQTADKIAGEIDSQWNELNSLSSQRRVEAIANICRQVLDSPLSGPRIIGDLSDKFTREDEE
jgi:hypothetical protein